ALLAGCQEGTGEAASSSSSETRTVTDATGAEVEVPENPEAVATLHYAATETQGGHGHPALRRDRNAHGPRCAARRPGGVPGTGRARGMGRRARRHPRRRPA